ncbi:MAG: bifunctional diaminohydroxyphosphoribosylaminopyrimidine deaminase/5-amino-6-(5-phosphoribosylamino)uracil reductase RibD [Prevotellaceae bacterium]|nr:bifunctional diaminohydroxyphosphoribosylaminopyrimidine deaminase/5-amino-6-(5-phosphoribosylamino)uracil reductase RibD [Prevotellaceae bacterium]
MRDEFYMHRCLQLARNGELGAPPNPMVGAVLVHEDRVIGEGYHARCGEAHAEVNALKGIDDEMVLKHSTLYVSLEPCAHYGKTPPCAELIIRKKIGRVVVGCVDPFAKVGGRGIQMLREAGIEVLTGVLEPECLALNRRFITFHTLHRPYITLKWAQTADGVIGLLRRLSCAKSGEQAALRAVAISNAATLRRVHHLRATHQAILVGWRTAQNDHPTLTTRHWSGPNPRRIIYDSHAHTLTELLATLYEQGVQSLLVEGGANTLRQFMNSGLWDEIHVEKSDKSLSAAPDEQTALVYAPAVPQQAHLFATQRIGGHTIERYANPQTQPILTDSHKDCLVR